MNLIARLLFDTSDYDKKVPQVERKAKTLGEKVAKSWGNKLEGFFVAGGMIGAIVKFTSYLLEQNSILAQTRREFQLTSMEAKKLSDFADTYGLNLNEAAEALRKMGGLKANLSSSRGNGLADQNDLQNIQFLGSFAGSFKAFMRDQAAVIGGFWSKFIADKVLDPTGELRKRHLQQQSKIDNILEQPDRPPIINMDKKEWWQARPNNLQQIGAYYGVAFDATVKEQRTTNQILRSIDRKIDRPEQMVMAELWKILGNFGVQSPFE